MEGWCKGQWYGLTVDDDSWSVVVYRSCQLMSEVLMAPYSKNLHLPAETLQRGKDLPDLFQTLFNGIFVPQIQFSICRRLCATQSSPDDVPAGAGNGLDYRSAQETSAAGDEGGLCRHGSESVARLEGWTATGRDEARGDFED